MKYIIPIFSISITCLYAFVGVKNNSKNNIAILNDSLLSIQRGKLVYAKECVSCHQSDGGGVPHLNPPMAQSTTLLKDKNKSIIIVLKGLTDRVPIDDEYYSNSMASHAYLSNQAIADVLSFARNNFGNKASIILPKEVASVRLKLTPKK